MSGLEKMKLLVRYSPMLLTIVRWKRRDVAAYLAAYRNPFLREALRVAGDARMSALVLVMVLGFRSRNNAGYIVGGSRAFAQAIADRYTRLGGVFRYSAQVESVTVENCQVTGVRCADGTAVPGPPPWSPAPMAARHSQDASGPVLRQTLRYAYSRCEAFPPLFQASLGVNRMIPEAPRQSACLSRVRS